MISPESQQAFHEGKRSERLPYGGIDRILKPGRIMNAYLVSAIIAFGTYAAAADDARPTPQPRLRLDPATRTAVAEAEKKSPAGVTVMEKMVVKGTSVPMERPKEQPYNGEFSAQQGGRVLNGGSGPARWELGVWPSIDLMFTDSGFRPRAEPRLNADLVRIKF